MFLDLLDRLPQLLPLLRKQIEVDGVSLKDVRMNTEDLIPSVALQGTLGEFYLSSHGVALDPEIAIVNKALLRRTHLTVSLRDTTTTDTTETSSPTYWKILVKSLQCEDVDVALHLTDTTRMAVGLGNLDLQGGEIDLRHAAYSLRRLVVKDGAFSMDNDTLEALPGLDPAHLSFTQWNAEIDSASYQGRRMAAVIRNFALNERSGLQVRSFTGRLDADDEAIRLPELRLETSDSYVETRARIDWKALEGGGSADMSVRLLAELGKQDLMLLAGGMPEAFVRAYPNAPLTLRAGVDGNMQQLKLTGLQSELKGVYELSAKGEVYDVLDNRKRRGEVVLDAVTHDLDCVAALAGLADSTLVIPRGITFKGNAIAATDLQVQDGSDYDLLGYFGGTAESLPVQESTTYYGLDAEGSAFVQTGFAPIASFQAFATLPTTPQAAPQTLSIFDDGDGQLTALPNIREALGDRASGIQVYTADGGIRIESAKAGSVTVYTVDGQALQTVALTAGGSEFVALPAGKYIVNGTVVIAQ